VSELLPDGALPGRDREGAVVVAEVLEELPSLLYRLRTAGQQQIVGHPVGAAERNFVRLLKGDRVEVELSRDDPGRGRIVRKLP
jgi:translation initiation factor IF-1